MVEKLIPVKGNHVIIRNEDLKNGLLTSLVYTDSIGNGSLLLSGAEDGSFISQVYETEEFNNLIASWNTETPEETWAEVFVRVHVKAADKWSSWVSWGRWGTFIKRNCPDFEEELVYSDCFRNGGDSTVNVKGKNTADAFQIKAVLHAEKTAEAMPSLRLLAATWKNTNDPDWQTKCGYPEETVEEKEAILLNTPAISQMSRDPDYGNVVCSATTIAMQMGGLGKDVLPEEAVFTNFDYGFGGNGNWSFSAAAAAAYGFESYISYGSFASLRQELSKGNAVGLSVKYSNRKDADVPYMANTLLTTHGHLISIVGYYFNKELGEYVYYSNDPAGWDDLAVGPREYRESHLNKAWYRRTMYIVHKKDLPSCGENVRRYYDAVMVPAEGKTRTYTLLVDGEKLALPNGFIDKRTRRQVFGHGTICYYAEDEVTETAESQNKTESNHIFYYEGIKVDSDGDILIANDHAAKLAAEGKKVKFMVIANNGKTWTAWL